MQIDACIPKNYWLARTRMYQECFATNISRTLLSIYASANIADINTHVNEQIVGTRRSAIIR